MSLSKPRFVCDVDGVVANFVQGVIEFAEETGQPLDVCCWKDVATYLFFTDSIWNSIKNSSLFWLSLRRMPGVRKTMIVHHIFPDVYLTSRPIDSHVTRQWLRKEMLPTASVVTVNHPHEKIEHLRVGDVFVDDHPSTIQLALENNVTAFLMKAPFHRGVDEKELKGLPTIRCLSEIERFVN